MVENPVFLELAKLGHPAIMQDDRNIFDNRIDGDHLGSVGFISSPEDRRDFYRLKFAYYTAKIDVIVNAYEGARAAATQPYAIAAVQPQACEFDVSSSLASTLDQWFADEVKAYMLRRLHTPVAVVHDTWYNDLEEFTLWAASVDALAASHTTADLARLLGARFPVCIEEEATLVEACRKLCMELESVLRIPVPNEAGILALRTDHLRAARSNIGASVAAKLAAGPSSLEDVLDVIVRSIKDEYHVKVCDYLEVTTSDDYPKLRLLVSSWESSKREAIRQTENAYAKAGGITGSVFLLTANSGYRWIGTNLLGEDSRQSLRHKLLFESVYGETSAFLVFPVFDGANLAGALRVIEPDRAGRVGVDSEGRPGTWPLEVRAELSHLADWIGSLIPLLRNALPGGTHDSPLAEVSRYRPGWLDFLPIRYLSSVLTESVRIASMRSEHRAVGCTIALGTRGACDSLAERTRPYPAVQKERRLGLVEHATDLFGRVVPGASVFVCEIPDKGDTGVLPLSYSMILATGELSTEAAAKKYEAVRELCLIDVDGERRVIRLFERGRWSGDYFINEKTGRWQLRVGDSIIRRLHDRAPLARAELVSNLVCKYLIPYSYEGHGGLVLLAEALPRRLIAEDGFDVRLPLDDMDPAVFSTIVSVDGGTWIDGEGMVRQAGIIYASGAGEEARPEGGARHKAAQTLAVGCSDGLVFAVSANRVITCLAGEGRALRF